MTDHERAIDAMLDDLGWPKDDRRNRASAESAIAAYQAEIATDDGLVGRLLEFDANISGTIAANALLRAAAFALVRGDRKLFDDLEAESRNLKAKDTP